MPLAPSFAGPFGLPPQGAYGRLWLRRRRDTRPKEEKNMASTELTVKIIPNDKGNPPGKLADAELYFTAGPLEGLKLIGFSIWERRGGGGRNVTFPARQYPVNGERRSFALLRPIADTAAQNRIGELVLDAYVASRSVPLRRPRGPGRPSRALRVFDPSPRDARMRLVRMSSLLSGRILPARSWTIGLGLLRIVLGGQAPCSPRTQTGRSRQLPDNCSTLAPGSRPAVLARAVQATTIRKSEYDG